MLAAAVCNSVVRSLADLTVEAITVMLLQAQSSCDGQTETCILTIHHDTVLDHAHAEPSPLFYLPRIHKTFLFALFKNGQ